MHIDELDPLCVNYRFILNDENSRKFTDLLTRARATPNKEEARHVRTKADTIVFRDLLSQLDKIGALS